MFDYISSKKELISSEIAAHLKKSGNDLSFVNNWGQETARRIKEFTVGGKMIRGALILFAHDMCGGEKTEEAMKAACSIELLQSYLLIHDDIMDRDQFRRGAPSIYYSFQRDAEEKEMNAPARYGESMGICAGDVTIFIALNLLAQSPNTTPKLMPLFFKEMTLVGLGQMQDVFFSHSRGSATSDEVTKLYRYKTSRYTFSLPLAAGALIAGKNEIASQLETIGENLGIIFQIRDDELGLFGTTEDIGKVAGSDITEGKMTIFMTELLTRLTTDEKAEFQAVYGNENITDSEKDFIRSLVELKGVRDFVITMAKNLATETEMLIKALPVSEKYQDGLLKLLAYNLSRTK